ncbi:MAG: flagellar assembly protein FliH [Thauera sp.]|nr:flagellar assembly protein FliH [Thauera sp.]
MSIARHQAVGAYRRWEPTDFDAEDGAGEAAALPPGAAAPAAPPPPRTEVAASTPPPAPAPEPTLPPDFQLPTAEEIERMHDEMRRAGFDEGRQEGYAAGLEARRSAGYAEGKAHAEAAAAQLAALADGLDEGLRKLDDEIAEELMALAIEMARRMVKLTLAEHPETILDTVRSALLQLPQGHAQIQLHPDDLALVREHLGEQIAHAGHRLQESDRLQRGECRIDGPGAQVDATLATRWRRVLESIGHERASWQLTDTAPGDIDADTPG